MYVVGTQWTVPATATPQWEPDAFATRLLTVQMLNKMYFHQLGLEPRPLDPIPRILTARRQSYIGNQYMKISFSLRPLFVLWPGSVGHPAKREEWAVQNTHSDKDALGGCTGALGGKIATTNVTVRLCCVPEEYLSLRILYRKYIIYLK